MTGNGAEQQKILTVFEQAGQDATNVLGEILSRHPSLVSLEMATALIRAEREWATQERLKARQENRDNNDYSIAPGLKATLTPEGYDTARQSAETRGFAIEEATVVNNGLAVVTLPRGAYSTYGDCYFYEEATYDEKHKQVEHGEVASFWVAYSGVIMIEGLVAQERWLNWNFNPDGSPRER